MQRVVQRSQRAVREIARATEKEKKGRLTAESKRRTEETQRLTRSISRDIKEARKNRRIDWEAGPLAPRRDVGDKAKTYGTVSMYDLHLPDRNPEDRLRWDMFKPGDRVVITKGRDRGRIGSIGEVNKAKAAAVVKDLNVLDVFVPEWIRKEMEEHRDVVPISQLIPVDHLKLVYPLPHPETGMPRDVVIDKVVQHGDDRLIPGANVVIPSQPKVESEEDESEVQEDDSPPLEAEQQTFTPCLLHPPMPMTVIDELRSKYSMFRKRHDHDYIQKKEQEEERVERRAQLGKTMRTPLQELAELRARQKKAEERELTEEQLAKIGEVMEQEQARTERLLRASKLPTPVGQNVQIDNTV